jgi:hypothetical protein
VNLGIKRIHFAFRYQNPYHNAQMHVCVHTIVPGGAISNRDRQWHASSAGFYLPVRALSTIYRAKFREATAAQGLLADIPAELWRIGWNVHCQPVGDGQATLGYLARYVFKVAISDSIASRQSTIRRCAFAIASRTAIGRAR